MLLSKSDIKNEKLLEFAADDFYRDASYDLRIDTIYNPEKKAREKDGRFVLKPGGMALAFSDEVFNLSSDVLGITTVKNSLSNDGVMAVNIGLVDPNYVGPISCILINFGKIDKILVQGDPFLRMSFQRIPEINKTQSRKTQEEFLKMKETYVTEKIKNSSNKLGKTFLSLDSFENNILQKTKITIFKEILKQIGYIALLVTLVSYGVSQFTGFSKETELKTLEKKIIRLNKELKILKDKNTNDPK